jgi:hypothetical protein
MTFVLKTTNSLWAKRTIPAESFLVFEADTPTEYCCDNTQCLLHAASENKLELLLEWDFVYDVLHIVDKYEKEQSRCHNNVLLASKAYSDFFFDSQLHNPIYMCTYCNQDIFKNSSTCVYTLLSSTSSCSANHAQLVDTKAQSNAVVCMTGCIDVVTGRTMLAPAIFFPNDIDCDTEVIVFREFTSPVPGPAQKPENRCVDLSVFTSKLMEYSEESQDLNDVVLKSTALFKSNQTQYDKSFAQTLALVMDESHMFHNINTTRAEMNMPYLHT